MAEGPPAPLIFPQPVHVWVFLSATDRLGPASSEMANGEISTGCCIQRGMHTMRCVLQCRRRVTLVSGMNRGDGYVIFR